MGFRTIFFTVLLCASSAWSDPLDNWQLRNQAYPRVIRRLAEHNGLFVAVGTRGDGFFSALEGQLILTSTNGTDWPTNLSSSGPALSGVVYGADRWVAVGKSGTVLISSDGQTWEPTPVPTSNNLSAVVFGNNSYVAVGGDTIWSSNGGVDWTPVLGLPSGRVAFGSGVFVAVGSGVFFSANAQEWTFATNLTFSAITYGNGAFFAAANFNHLFRSADGIQWVQLPDTDVNVSTLGFVKGSIVATAGGVVETSSNGTNWTRRIGISTLHYINCLAENGDIAVAAGRGLLVSRDGIAWKDVSRGGTAWVFGAAGAFHKLFVSGEWGDPGRLLISSDSGATWEDADPPALTGMYSLAYGKGKLVGAGWSGGIYSSTNGQDWSSCGVGTWAVNFRSIAFGGSNFVAVGDLNGNLSTSRPLLYSSPDGETWTFQDARLAASLSSVVYGTNGFVAVGGLIFRSTTGTTPWNRIIGPASVYDVSYGKGRFVAVGPSGAILVSSNSSTWTQVSAPTTNNLNSVAYGGGIFLVSDSSGRIFSSTDGLDWAPRSVILEPIRLKYAEGTFLGIGSDSNARIMQSDPLWRLSIERQAHTLGLQATGVSQIRLRIESSEDVSRSLPWNNEGIITIGSAGTTMLSINNTGQRFFRAVSVD